VRISWRNIQKYVHDLALLGSYSPATLIDLIENLSPDQKIWAIIALGFSGEEDIHDRLKEIITRSDNIPQKAMAIEAISQYKDTSDIPILVNAALEDDNSISWKTDSDIIGFNPVGMASDKALWEMGYILEWDGEEYVLKRKEDVKIKYPKPKSGDQNE